MMMRWNRGRARMITGTKALQLQLRIPVSHQRHQIGHQVGDQCHELAVDDVDVSV